jgi:hypothetical protein
MAEQKETTSCLSVVLRVLTCSLQMMPVSLHSLPILTWIFSPEKRKTHHQQAPLNMQENL